jgi:hypothetical protein
MLHPSSGRVWQFSAIRWNIQMSMGKSTPMPALADIIGGGRHMAKKLLVQDRDKFIVRLPAGMRDAIAGAAAHNARSMNAELVARLEMTFDPAMISEEMAEQIGALHEVERQLANSRAALVESENVRDVQGKFIEALSRENEALRKAGLISEQLVMEFAHAVAKAARGDTADLDHLVGREKEQPMLSNLVTVWSIVKDD